MGEGKRERGEEGEAIQLGRKFASGRERDGDGGNLKGGCVIGEGGSRVACAGYICGYGRASMYA